MIFFRGRFLAGREGCGRDNQDFLSGHGVDEALAERLRGGCCEKLRVLNLLDEGCGVCARLSCVRACACTRANVAVENKAR